MKKRILAVAMSIMATMMVITGCGSKESKEPTDNGVATKLDESVKAEDLLSVENMQSFENVTELKDFVGAVKLNLNFDATIEAEETSDIKADLGVTVASDGKVLHTITDVNANVMGEEASQKVESWYSDETKTQYMQEGDNWVKYTDVDLEDVFSDYLGMSESMTTVDTEEMLKEFELVLNNEAGVYELKYEAGIAELIKKLPEDMLDEMTEGVDINTIIEGLNLPEDFKVTCVISFNPDKSFKEMNLSISAAKLDLSELTGTTLVIDIKEVKINMLYSDTEALTIPADIVEHAAEPEEDGFWTDWEDYEDTDWEDYEDLYDEESEDEDLEVEIELEEN